MTSPMLSNPILDELYAIRRIMVSMYKAHSQGPQPDPWKLAYYAAKTQALNQAIAAFIQLHSVPIEHQEQQPADPDSMLKSATAGSDARQGIRIPGGA